MFCWPSRRGSSSRKKSKSSDLSFTGSGGGDDEKSITGGSVGGNGGGGGILVKSYKQKKKGGKNATFKCDLSEALLPPSDECLINSRSASCNSSIRELNGYRGNSNKQFVSSQTIPPVEENSDSVNNNNNNKKTGGEGVSNNNNNYRSAEVLLFYSNNSLSTRNSVQDFIDNEDFNYKSLWGKDINEWDSRESRCNTLERDNNKSGANTTSAKSSDVSKSQKEKRLSAAASSPSLSISSSNPRNREDPKQKYFANDNEPLPSPPPTPPEAKICLDNLSLGTCTFFKYPQTRDQKSAQSQTKQAESKIPPSSSSPPPLCRINSSTSTSSLSSSYILTPEINNKPIILPTEDTSLDENNKLSKWTTTATQTLPFWQLEFPGILHCSSCLTSRSSHDSGILVNGGGAGEGGVDSPTTPLLILATSRGHESPGGDSSSGISSSDDNLESLHADEEIMLKSLKNSFLHQAIPFQLCNLSINNSSNNTTGKDKGSVGGGGGGSATLITSTQTTNSSVYKENVKNEQQECHLPQQLENEPCIRQEHDHIPSVTNEEDRNRLGPVGKNYGSSALDANANESEGPLLRGQTNGELEPSAKSCTKVPGSAEPLISDPSTNNHVISKNKSAVAHNNRVSSHNQHNAQNSVLVQENSSLKEEVSRLTSIVSDLQEQISRLATSGEETKKTLEGCLKDADKKCVALGIVAQQLDKQRLSEYEQLVQQQAENKEWKHQLDEKLAELQKLQSEYEKEREQNQEEMRALAKRHELEIDITVKNCEDKLEQLEQRHNLTLLELKRSHEAELEKLQEDHRQKLEELQHQQQLAIEEFQDEHPETRMLKEIDSLRAIVDMKLERIKFLEKQVVDHEQLTKDFQASKDSEARLFAKIEDINAQLEKARKDRRDTIAKCLKMEEDLKTLTLENERLLRSKEELEWKLKPFENEENKNKK